MSRFLLASIIAGQWGIITGIALTLLGVIIGQRVPTASTFFTTIGTATFTAALIGIIYESFQKEIFAGDLKSMFTLSASLQDSGIVNIAEPKSDAMSKLFQQQELKIIPINPFEWYSNYKSAFYHAVCTRRTRIEIWIPEYDDSSIADILTQQGHQTAIELEQDLIKFLRQIEADWNSASVHPDSYLEVRSYKDIPRIGVYFGETESILEYQAASPESPTVYRLTWIEAKPDGDFYDWSSSEVSRVSKSPGTGTRLIRPTKRTANST